MQVDPELVKKGLEALALIQKASTLSHGLEALELANAMFQLYKELVAIYDAPVVMTATRVEVHDHRGQLGQ